MERGDWETAARYAEKAVLPLGNYKTEESLLMAYSYTYLGLVYQRLCAFKQSLFFEETALQIRQRILGADYIEPVVNLNNLGHCLFRYGGL